jgi:hypothetical protein
MKLTGIGNCDCGRPQRECVKGDMDRCPALDDDDDASMECPACGGSTITIEGFDCEECCGMGRVSL